MSTIGHNSGAIVSIETGAPDTRFTHQKYTAAEIEAGIRAKIRADNIRVDSAPKQVIRWEIWLSDLPAKEKLLRLAVLEHANADGSSARPSIDRLRIMAGGSKRDIAALLEKMVSDGTATVSKGSGRRSNEYRLYIPESTLIELEKLRSSTTNGTATAACGTTMTVPQSVAVPHMVPQGDGTENSSSTTMTVPQAETAENRSSTILPRSSTILDGTLPCKTLKKEDLGEGIYSTPRASAREDGFAPRMPEVPDAPVFGTKAKAVAIGLAASLASLPAAAQEPTGFEPPAQVQQAQMLAPCWQTPRAMQNALTNADERKAQFQVWKTGTGMIQVAGEFKAELETVFQLVDMTAGLAASEPHCYFDQGALRVMAAIRRTFGLMLNDVKGKDRRYQAAASSGQQTKRQFNGGSPDSVTDESRKNLRTYYKNNGLNPDDVLRQCAREKCWRRKAVGMWADTPDQAAAELERLGIPRGEWSTWTIEAPSA